ncbi:MAG: hypothetical protein JJU34_16815 [Lunatimonas sp.]|uniref:Bor family protein n=1 Tax=Lunatimonas sp. TaxID=2060141 RepID=UPI00263B6EF8|nr:Bor family protein [Lunatimonas sp.]MCC5938942.1 hypothetical protein [Lunatimonas sp.]
MKNQLIMTCAALLCLACVEEVTGNLPVPPIQMPVGTPTAIGTPIGDIITQEIGPNGGTIQWDNGTYQLVFPPGALDKSTTIRVQAITHTLDHGLGTAFDFGPDGTQFAKPVELIYHYTDESMEGTLAGLVHVAFQDEKNVWQALRNLEVNTTAQTLTAKLPHFSRWSFFASAMIAPGQKSLGVGQSVDLEVLGYEYELNLLSDPKNQDLLAPLVPPSPIKGQLVKEWLIDGKASGTQPEKGRLSVMSSHRSRATYTAPLEAPEAESIMVSAELNLGKGKFLLLSHLSIQPDNRFSVGTFDFRNAAALIGLADNVLTIHMYKPNQTGYEAVLSFIVPGFGGNGNYPFSKEVNGGVEIIDAYRNFASTAYNDKSEPYFNGSIQITESSTQVGGSFQGSIQGTLYEAVEKNGTVIYEPFPIQASFVDGLLNALTFGLYTPTTTKVVK